MQKNKILTISIFLILILAFASASLTKEEKAKINDCKKNCNEVKKLEYNLCKDTYNECRNSCKTNYKSCIDEQKEIRKQCESSCDNDECKSECNKDYNLNKKSMCDFVSCKKECSATYKDCRTLSAADYKECRDSCPYVTLNDNIECENGYKPKETFAQGCEICQCNYNGKITCEKTDYCHFPTTEVEKTLCESSGGLFHALCKGPYFGVVCSKDKFCICSGFEQYSCPLDHTCVKDFIPPKIKESSLPGWRDLLGNELGDIGVCAQNLEIESCGNELCEPIFLETDLTCPTDCQ